MLTAVPGSEGFRFCMSTNVADTRTDARAGIAAQLLTNFEPT